MYVVVINDQVHIIKTDFRDPSHQNRVCTILKSYISYLTEIGKAYLRAMAAKNISMQIRKFW